MASIAGALLLAVATTTASAQTTRVSVAADGTQRTGESDVPAVSADGRWVAFQSTAFLTPDDPVGLDIFLKDRQTGAVVHVSPVNTPGASDSGSALSISADGRFVAFHTRAALVPDDTNTCPVGGQSGQVPCSDVYVYDRQSASFERVSVGPGGVQGDFSSIDARISGDGRYVVFTSRASTLVPNDTDSSDDVFLHDRQTSTTTQISVTPSGAQSPAASFGASISEDGSTIAFISSVTLAGTADPLSCPISTPCERVYVHERATGTTTRLQIPHPNEGFPNGVAFRSVRMSGDGRFLALVREQLPAQRDFLLFNRQTAQLIVTVFPTDRGVAFSRDGRYMAACGTQTASRLMVTDLTSGSYEFIPAPPPTDVVTPDRHCTNPALSGDGALVVFASTDVDLVTADTNETQDIFAFDRDGDQDGMPSEWEKTFGLDPTGPGDATLDTDGDGATNLQEYRAGTHPRGTVTRYLAEGASNAFFQTSIYLLYPGDLNENETATAVVRLLGANGATSSRVVTLTRGRPFGISPENEVFSGFETEVLAPADSFGTVVESDHLVVVEREMAWFTGTGESRRRIGTHGETALLEPRTTWYFAEGATHGPFDLFYLLQNPGATNATATVTYLLPNNQPAIVRNYLVPARSRLTIWVDEQTGLGDTDVSAKIVADQPLLAERAMYLSLPDQAFAGGHDGAAVPEPLIEWFVAEGVTGSFFDTYILVGNPGNATAALTVTYFLPDGTTVEKQHTVGPESRLTIDVAVQDSRLTATSVSARVRSTNGVPIIVERATWWPRGGWYEGHLTAATNGTAQKWGLAYAPARSFDDVQTFLLIANPTATAGTAAIKLQGSRGGSGPITCTANVPLPAQSRVTVNVAEICQLGAQDQLLVGGTIESSGPGIVVEKVVYETSDNRFWNLGEAVPLTKLP